MLLFISFFSSKELYASEHGKLDFMEMLLSAGNELLLERFQFAANCEHSMPLRNLEENGQVKSFHEFFINQWRELTEKGR